MALTARAASDSANAPGAHGVLPKATTHHGNAVGEIGSSDRATPWALDFLYSQTAATALNKDGIATHSNDRADF